MTSRLIDKRLPARRQILPAILMLSTVGGCGDGSDAKDGGSAVIETLSPEPAAAPVDVADGRLGCIGAKVADGTHNAIELTGYVRTLLDPDATKDPPAAKVEIFSASGTPLGSAFSDPSKTGRVAVSVPVTKAGFTGSAVTTAMGYLDYRLQSSKAVIEPEFNGWTWLATSSDVDDAAKAIGVTIEAGRAVLIGAVHDCDGVGVQNVVIQVGGSTDGIFYVAGFAPTSGRGFTTEAGRFVVPNMTPGDVPIKAFARLEKGGKLTLISSITAKLDADRITAVDLQPRTGDR